MTSTIDDVIAAQQQAIAAQQNAMAVAQAYQPPIVIPPPATVGNPRLLAMAPNSIIRLPDFAPQLLPNDNIPAIHICDQSPLSYDVRRRRGYVIGGGHAGSNNNGLQAFDLDALMWSTLYEPTPLADLTEGNYDKSLGAWIASPSGGTGPYPRATGRHAEQCNPVVGDELIMLKYVDGNGANLAGLWNGAPGTTLSTLTTGKVAHFNLVTQQWRFSSADCFPSGTERTSMGMTGWPAAVYDEQSGLILLVSRDGIWTYNPVTEERKLVKRRGVPGMSTAMALVYYPPTDRYYWLTFQGLVFEIVFDRANPANSTVAQKTTSGTFVIDADPTNAQSTNEKAFGYHRRSGKIMTGPALDVDRVPRFNFLDVPSMTWTSIVPDNGDVDGVKPGILFFHCGCIAPDEGVWIWIDPYSRSWAYKPPLTIGAA